MVTWIIVGGAVEVKTRVVVGCRIIGVRDEIAAGIGDDDDAIALIGDDTGVALANRWENAAGGLLVCARMGLLGLFLRRHSSHAATYKDIRLVKTSLFKDFTGLLELLVCFGDWGLVANNDDNKQWSSLRGQIQPRLNLVLF